MMSLDDLKLLIDVAWHDHYGKTSGFAPTYTFRSALDRLLRDGLIVQDPNHYYARVTLTPAGEARIVDLMAMLGGTR